MDLVREPLEEGLADPGHGGIETSGIVLSGFYGDAPLEAVAVEDESIGGAPAQLGDLIYEMILGGGIVQD